MLLCEHGLFTIPPDVFLWGFTFQKLYWSKELEKCQICRDPFYLVRREEIFKYFLFLIHGY